MLRLVPLATAVLLAAPAFSAAPAAAAGQPTCDTRDKILRHLGQKYSESPVAMGVANTGGVVELLSSRDGQTWTLLVTMPNGRTCLLAAGEELQNIAAPQIGQKS